MKHYYGFTYEEIAEMMNVPTGTIKSRVSIGLKGLRKELKADET
ncbi:sigma factor-like helix-turn-helix DNA-binding protein [Paenibacillus larvae]|nr:sigma factor-like helix-turn-helix DNA-binding protein [Paenibacillus larvae]MDR5594328.1 sigma factor-like helix-turn-helix DNA-binding protein [Paenibacillus larvae]